MDAEKAESQLESQLEPAVVVLLSLGLLVRWSGPSVSWSAGPLVPCSPSRSLGLLLVGRLSRHVLASLFLSVLH